MQSFSLAPKGLSMPAESNHVRVEHNILAWPHNIYPAMKARMAALEPGCLMRGQPWNRVEAASLARHTSAYPVLERPTIEVGGSTFPNLGYQSLYTPADSSVEEG